jgi:hypothetical protein
LKVNSTREEFFNTLTESDFSAKFLYFYCHGQGAGDPQNPNSGNSSHITLTDNEKITVEDIQYILQQKDLICSPFVFINACQGGQMTTLFYKTIGAEFLKRKSLGLIGPQIDMPIVFAAEYAQRFFQIFIGSQEPVRIGCLMKRLSNDFLFLHKNPLGLAYSLYHGADCYIDRDSEIS